MQATKYEGHTDATNRAKGYKALWEQACDQLGHQMTVNNELAEALRKLRAACSNVGFIHAYQVDTDLSEAIDAMGVVEAEAEAVLARVGTP